MCFPVWSIQVGKIPQISSKSYQFVRLIILFQEVDILRLLKIYIMFFVHTFTGKFVYAAHHVMLLWLDPFDLRFLGRDGGLRTLVSQLQVCLSVEGAKNVSGSGYRYRQIDRQIDTNQLDFLGMLKYERKDLIGKIRLISKLMTSQPG